MREQPPEQAEGAASLAECGVSIDRDLLLQELAAAFCDYFEVRLESDSLSEAEQADREGLVSNRYRSDAWNLEGMAE
jgi:lipoate-protein ligase A